MSASHWMRQSHRWSFGQEVFTIRELAGNISTFFFNHASESPDDANSTYHQTQDAARKAG